jgi:hypothetical protein
MATYCDSNHPEVLHWESDCPVCALIELHARSIALLEEKIAMQTGTIEEQGAQIEAYRVELKI